MKKGRDVYPYLRWKHFIFPKTYLYFYWNVRTILKTSPMSSTSNLTTVTTIPTFISHHRLRPHTKSHHRYHHRLRSKQHPPCHSSSSPSASCLAFCTDQKSLVASPLLTGNRRWLVAVEEEKWRFTVFLMFFFMDSHIKRSRVSHFGVEVKGQMCVCHLRWFTYKSSLLIKQTIWMNM